MDIEEDPTIKEFFQSRSLKPATIRSYLAALNKYANFTGLTLNELILEAEHQEDERIRMRLRNIRKYLLNFKEHLIEQDYSERHIQGVLSTVRTFYAEFEIELPRMKLSLKSTRNETISDIPTKENIITALENSNLQFKAIILLMATSGMGSSEIRSLSYHDFVKSLEDDINIPQSDLLNIDALSILIEEKEKRKQLIIPIWKIYRIKTGMEYITFSTPETIPAIIKYLKKYPPTSLEDPLFRTYHRRYSMAPNTLIKYFGRLNDKCGFGKNDRYGFFHSHSLRKYFATVLYGKGLQQLSVDWFLGHKIDKTTGAYFKSNPQKLKNQYITCISDLSMQDSKVFTYKSDEVIEMERERVKDRERIQKLEMALQVIQDIDKD